MSALIRCACGVLVDETILDRHVCDSARPAYNAAMSLLASAYAFMQFAVPIEEALIDGFDVEAWSKAVEDLAGGGHEEVERWVR